MLPPDFRDIHRAQQAAELQRFHEMNKMYANRYQDVGDKRESPVSDLVGGKRGRFSDSDNDIDDTKSVDNQSTKDETSSGTQSAAGAAGRKRKSMNPTRITTTTKENSAGNMDQTADEEFSSGKINSKIFRLVKQI